MLRALAGLARVASEVRVHPVVDGRARTSVHLDPTRRALEAAGLVTELRSALASDLLAADLVLRVRRRRRTGPARRRGSVDHGTGAFGNRVAARRAHGGESDA